MHVCEGGWAGGEELPVSPPQETCLLPFQIYILPKDGGVGKRMAQYYEQDHIVIFSHMNPLCKKCGPNHSGLGSRRTSSVGGLRLVFLLHLVAAQPKVISRQTASVQSQELQPKSQALAGIRGRFRHLALPALSLCKSSNGLRLGALVRRERNS